MEGQATYATTMNEDGDEDKFKTFINNFADDTMMITGSRPMTEMVVREFPKYLSKFQVEVHRASAATPKSKSVIVHCPATEEQARSESLEPIELESRAGMGVEYVQFTEAAVYLGAKISTTLSDRDEIRERIMKATQLYGSLRPHFLASKDVWPEVKRKVMVSMILPVMLDGAESWVVDATSMRELQSAYNKMVRGMLRLTTWTTRKYSITTNQTHQRLGLQDLAHYLDWEVLGYAGHVERMLPHRLPKKARDCYFTSARRRGAPHKTHTKQVRESIRRKEIPLDSWKSLSLNKAEWRKAIKRNIPSSKNQKRAASVCDQKPSDFIGQYVEKKFRHKYFVGRIIDTDVDGDSGVRIWGVEYDDGDCEDYNWRELCKIMCDDLACIV